MTRKHFLYSLLLLMLALFSQAQTKKSKTTQVSPKPESFVIERGDFEKLFNYKAGEVIRSQTNKYLDKSLMELNTQNGDMQLLRIKPAYFSKSLLMVQVSGQQSIQVFIISTDKKTFYRGKSDKGRVTMSRCKEEDIVTE